MATTLMANKLYIVLTRTNTSIAKAIRFYTREPYSHTSISFDSRLDVMYSFARRKIRNPLNAGFIEEHIDSGILGRDPDIDCAVYCLEFTRDKYDLIWNTVQELCEHNEEYQYNIIGLLTAAINRPYSRPKHFFCSEFAAWLLGVAGVKLTLKSHSLVRPEDFRQSLKLYKTYEGKLHQYAEYRTQHPDMDEKSVRKIS